jgi:hypothetical protein
VPDAIAPYARASATEKLRRSCAVLKLARGFYRAGGITIYDALMRAGDGQPQGVWARQIFQAAIGALDIDAWDPRYNPTTRRADVYETFDRCITACRDLRGGWRVSAVKLEAGPDSGIDRFEQLRRGGMFRRGFKPTVVGSER